MGIVYKQNKLYSYLNDFSRMTWRRNIIPVLLDKKIIATTNTDGKVKYLPNLGQKPVAVVQWALDCYQHPAWGKTNAMYKMSFVEECTFNLETNVPEMKTERVMESVEGLGFNSDDQWLNWWSCVEGLTCASLVPVKEATLQIMIKKGLFEPEDPKEEEEKMEEGANEGKALGPSVTTAENRAKETSKRASKNDPFSNVVYWPKDKGSSEKPVELKAIPLPVVKDKNGKVIPHTFAEPVNRRIGFLTMTGVYPQCAYPIATTYVDKKPQDEITVEETQHVCGFDTQKKASEFNMTFKAALQNEKALVFREVEPMTVWEYARDACTGRIRNVAGAQRLVEATNAKRPFKSVVQQLGANFNVVFGQKTDANGPYKEILDANTSSTAAGGFFSQVRAKAPTFPDHEGTDRQVSQAMLGRCISKPVNTTTMIGDDVDVADEVSMTKLAKEQRPWASHDLKKVRDIFYVLGVAPESWLPDNGGMLLTLQGLMSLYTNRGTTDPMGTDNFAKEVMAEAKMLYDLYLKKKMPASFCKTEGDKYCHLLQAMILVSLNTGPDGVTDKVDHGRFLNLELLINMIAGSGINALDHKNDHLNKLVESEQETMGEAFKTTMLERVKTAVQVFGTLMSFKVSALQACHLTPIIAEMMRVVDSSKTGEYKLEDYVAASLVSYYTKNPDHLLSCYAKKVPKDFFWSVWPKIAQFNVCRTESYVKGLTEAAKCIYDLAVDPEFTKDPVTMVLEIKQTGQQQKRKVALEVSPDEQLSETSQACKRMRSKTDVEGRK